MPYFIRSLMDAYDNRKAMGLDTKSLLAAQPGGGSSVVALLDDLCNMENTYFCS